MKWTPEVTEKVTGVPAAQIKAVAKMLAENRPGALVWCMGGTQHHNGNNNTRAYCVLQLALGNIGKSGGGANIFRGHDNVQGVTDVCVVPDSLPAYYGLATGAWKHWARVWDVSYDYLKGRFADQKLMEKTGIPLSRWIDGVLEDKKNIDQPNNIRAMVFWGHAANSQTRLPEMKKAMEKLDLMVVVDPVPTFASVIPDRQDGIYVLPATTQFETSGSVTATNRSLQWRDKVFAPWFEAKVDHEIMYLFAKKFGFDKEMFKNIPVKNNEPVIEDITREWNKGSWVIGYTGQSPERLKAHMANQEKFDPTTLLGKGGEIDGDYYGLPWPCWGTAEIKHPGTPILYDPSKSVARGGLHSEPASASNTRVKVSWPTAPTRRTWRSRTAIPSSPWPCFASCSGTRISHPRSLRPSRRSPGLRRPLDNRSARPLTPAMFRPTTKRRRVA